ncbi:hypothetical protein LCGC14_2552310 [marine sediment metagenome]|uniref:Uncharacterized protein n=1 Tax=marine sediment metagenome TaxID=412755 RepID=A0A0F9DFK4_9ZZZZ
MPEKLIKVNTFIGVYYIKAKKKRYQGRPDKCFYITYKINNPKKKIREKIGWASEGYTAQLASYARSCQGRTDQKNSSWQ